MASVIKPYDLRIAYISWGEDGKKRPVLIMDQQEEKVYVYKITTQYHNKNSKIKANYLSIKDWQQAGLHKSSYIDTNTLLKLHSSAVDSTLIGELSQRDIGSLEQFLGLNHF